VVFTRGDVSFTRLVDDGGPLRASPDEAQDV